MDHSKFLISLLEDVPTNAQPIPPSRIILFAGGTANLREDKRLSFWKKGITVTEDKATLLEWAESLSSWPSEDGEEADHELEEAPPPLIRQASSGFRTLRNMRMRLQTVSVLLFLGV